MSKVVVLHQISLIAGLIGSAGLVVGLVLYYERKVRFFRKGTTKLSEMYGHKILEAALESQETERKRFAADLHDDVGATLAATRLGLESLARQHPVIGRQVNEAIGLIDGTIDSVRRISHGLMPATLERFGLRQALIELCEQLAVSSGLRIDYLEEGEWFELGSQRETMIYRIVQELIQNAMKHAGVGPIVFRVAWGTCLTVEVSDQGSGFDATLRSCSQGIGLLNIENRARLLGGFVKYARRRPTGTRVELSIPVQ